MPYARLPHRPHLPTSDSGLQRLISKGTTWHFDAWITADTFNPYMHLIVVTSRGGRGAITEARYRLSANGAINRVPWLIGVPRLLGLARGEVPVSLETCSDVVAERIMHAHRYAYELSLAKPDEFKGKSVRFWYIPSPSLDPLEGVTNYFSYKRKDASTVPDST